ELLNQQTAAISPPVVPPNLTTPGRTAPVPDPVSARANTDAARRAAAEAQAKREALDWERQRQTTPSVPITSVPPSTSTPTPRFGGPVAPLSSPLSQNKSARLEELGAAYKADRITAAQYHAERARILAEP
ncbi:MAG TPA: hypothetical protein VK633_07000, partial [Verrucomicrobiae bacterium]|nr:hypothetical protein [Verrucomicrobiae bacterium]